MNPERGPDGNGATFEAVGQPRRQGFAHFFGLPCRVRRWHPGGDLPVGHQRNGPVVDLAGVPGVFHGVFTMVVPQAQATMAKPV